MKRLTDENGNIMFGDGFELKKHKAICPMCKEEFETSRGTYCPECVKARAKERALKNKVKLKCILCGNEVGYRRSKYCDDCGGK